MKYLIQNLVRHISYMFYKLSARKIKINSNGDIIYIANYYLGDFIICLPFFYALKAEFPNSRLFILGKQEFIPIYKKLLIPETYFIKIENFNWKDINIVINEFQISELKLIIDETGKRSIVLNAFLNRIDIIGKNSLGNAIFYSYCVNLSTTSGFDLLEFRFKFLVPFKIDYNRKYLEYVKFKGLKKNNKQKYITIQPFAGWDSKSITQDFINQIANYFKNEGYEVILLGSAKDIKKIDKKLAASCTNFVGKLSLEKTIDIIFNSRLNISADSFTSHLCYFLKVKSITFFGPTNPNVLGYSSNKNLYINEPISCMPKGMIQYCSYDDGRSCNNYLCMKGLSLNQKLINKINILLYEVD